MSIDTKKSFSANLGYGKGHEQNSGELEQEGSLFATDAAGSNAQIAHRAQVTRSQRRGQTPKQTQLQILGPSQQQIDELLTMPAPQDALSVRDARKKTGESKQQNTKPGRDLIKQLETPFGVSFAKVTIETSSSAAKSAGKQAFAQDDKIHFAKESVDSADTKDKVVLAHELVHMVQKSNTSGIAMTEAELEAEAHILGAMAAQGQSIAGKVKGYAARSERQFFSELGHRVFANRGARLASEGKSKEIDMQIVVLAPDYKLENGIANAMVDYFGNISVMRQLARNPEREGVGTREELEYVRRVKIAGNEFAEKNFSKEVKKAVDDRYHQLAANNGNHFITPQGERAFSSEGKESIPGGGNKQAYRDIHYQAIQEAVEAGNNKVASNSPDYQCTEEFPMTFQDAVATEATGNHYLTDAFASGHIRTHRNAITEYWNQKVPMFKTNLSGWMAEVIGKNKNICAKMTVDSQSMSDFMHKSTAPLDASYCIRPDVIYNGFLFEGARASVESLLSNKPLSFGDLVSGVFHDKDNHDGLRITHDGEKKTYYGDGMFEKWQKGEVDPKQHQDILGQANDVSQAVAISGEEIQTAYELSKQGLALHEIEGQIAPDGIYAAERLWPQLAEGDIYYQFSSAADLFGDPQFQEGVRIFIGEKIEEISKHVPEEHKQVFTDYIITPLVTDPLGTLQTIIEWTPNTGGGALAHNQDDNAMDYFLKAKATPQGLCSLTTVQRTNFSNNLEGGYTSGDERNAINDINNAKDCTK